MNMSSEIVYQHLINPELCFRCNSCEDRCAKGAIRHDDRNYVVDFELCNSCLECVAGCPSGAVDSWRPVYREVPYSLAQQLLWERLPEPADPALAGAAAAESPVEVIHGAPASATQAVENLYSRDHPLLATVQDSIRLTPPGDLHEIRHVELAVGSEFPFLEGQSIGVVPPGCDEQGRGHRMRLYSIASARNGERDKPGVLALTVKRVLEDREGQAYRGLCSNYVCDLRRGDQVEIAGPYGASFLMPNDPAARLLLIATGTGIAPMRAMIERRLRSGMPMTSTLLIYGGRTPSEMPYHNELMALTSGGLGFYPAYSRLRDQPKRYVQDALLEQSKILTEWLKNGNTHIYLCGLRSMELGVAENLQQICMAARIDWMAMRKQLVQGGRLHIETY